MVLFDISNFFGVVPPMACVRAKVEARNNLETYLYNLKTSYEDTLKGKIPEGDLEELKTSVEGALEVCALTSVQGVVPRLEYTPPPPLPPPLLSPLGSLFSMFYIGFTPPVVKTLNQKGVGNRFISRIL